MFTHLASDRSRCSKCCKQKYDVKDFVHVLYSLSYFDDADRERMPRLLWDIDWRTIKGAIHGWVHEVMRPGGE